MKLHTLAYRYAMEQDARRKKVILDLIVAIATLPEKRGGESIFARDEFDQTPLAIVYGLSTDPFTVQVFFERVSAAVYHPLRHNAPVKFVGLLNGYNVDVITNWAHIMELEEECERQGVLVEG